MIKRLVVLLLLISSIASAQETSDEKEYKDKYALEDDYAKFTLGFGMGLDFGGFGTRLTISPVKSLGLFAGMGYNLVGFGFNGGARFRFAPDKKVNPTLLAMYGYNGVIKVVDMDEYNGSYNGFTIGAGIQLNSRKKLNYWSFELLVPFRSQEFYDDVDMVSNDPRVDMTDPLPIAISVGYHLNLN
ncbi:hypothetical protein WBG78_23875 [Chryseolinea sp. T2]|uniref:hypothetical protein n=1 Tax=Chryseolinea sp. T2 TaxID=3129255 RepID=UPI003076EAD1